MLKRIHIILIRRPSQEHSKVFFEQVAEGLKSGLKPFRSILISRLFCEEDYENQSIPQHMKDLFHEKDQNNY